MGRSGEDGSFFTTIFGGAPFSRRELKRRELENKVHSKAEDNTYESGELFCADWALGLPLPVRCADVFGVAEAEARPGGDLGAVDTGAISTKDDRSCGAGDGAIAMAVLMMSKFRPDVSEYGLCSNRRQTMPRIAPAFICLPTSTP